MSTARARLKRRAAQYLSKWKVNIGLENSQGRTDINADAEDFCCGLLNIVMDLNLCNANDERMNYPAIDLADEKAGVCVQVTSTADATKITHTLEEFFSHDLQEKFSRLIVLILGDKRNYRKEFPRYEGFDFEPKRDIWDIDVLLTQIAPLSMAKLNELDTYFREQLGELDEVAPPMDLPVLSALDDNTFLGREAELADIGRKFDSDDKYVVLSGLGGMGKSELAVRFAMTRWGGESYFVLFTKNWKQTVLENIAPRIRGLNRDTPDEERIYRDVMAELRSRGPEELLIIDNVDDEAASLNQLKRELSQLSLRVLVTTRSDAEHAITVAQLRDEELFRLFEQHESNATPEEQRALIDAVDGHTLTVDLMARALRPHRRAATAEKLLKNLADTTIRKVDTAYPGGPAQAKIIEHLKVVFRVVELEEEEQELLRYATLLPAGGMDDKLFTAPLDEDMDDTLDDLTAKGWLSWNNDTLTIHPVIRKVCQEELKPTDENCGKFLEGIIAQYDEKEYDRERYRQMAELLTNASLWLEDDRGNWALEGGERWRDVGDYKQAQVCSIRAMEKLEQNPEADQAQLAMAVNNVGVTYGDLGDHRQALEYLKKALAIREQVLPADHPYLAASYNNVGLTYGHLGNHRQALEYQKKALSIQEQVLPADHPDHAASYNNVGLTYDALGDHRQALEYHKKALAIYEQVLPADHPNLATSYDNVGLTYDALGDHSKAQEYRKKALEILEKVLPADHPNLAASYNNVGYTYGYLGDHGQALEYHKKALAIYEQVLPAGHPDLAISYNNVGYAYGNLGVHRKALEYQKKAMEIREQVLPADHPKLALSCNNIAWTHYEMGNLQEAARMMRRAADIISRSSLPENHPDRINYPKWADELKKEAKMQQDMLARMQGFGNGPFLPPLK